MMSYPRKLYDPPKRITDPVMRLKDRQRKLTNSYVRGTITQAEYIRRNEHIEQQISALVPTCSSCGKPATTAAGPANEPICAECETEMMVELP